MSHVIELTEQSFAKEVLQSPIPVLVDFWAPWCGPCQRMIPILEEVSDIYAEKLKVAKLNVAEPAHQGLAQQFHVQGIPNMQIFHGGKVVKELVGSRMKEVLIGELQQVL